MPAVSVYPDTFSKDSKVIDAGSIMHTIAGGEYSDQINYLRSLGEKEYKIEKNKLPAITWSGVFEEGTRSIETLKQYSNLVCLDVDNLDLEKIKMLRGQMMEDDYIVFFFISPSGKGVKFIVQVNTGPDQHRAAFLHLQDHYEKKYLITIDKSGKDVSRLCYVSADNEAFFGRGQKIFEVDLKYGEIIVTNNNYSSHKVSHDLQKAFKTCELWVNRTKTYQQGERNIFIHALACALNRTGVDMQDTIAMITANYSPPDDKWHQSVRSAYFHYQHEHGSVQVRDIGVQEFVAPAYVANYTEDVAANDLMRYTAMLFHYQVPMMEIGGLIAKIAKYYKSMGYIDVNRASLLDLMNRAISKLNENIANQAAQSALKYVEASDLAMELVNQDLVAGVVPTGMPPFDGAMRGGLQPGNFYGLIGVGGTFKSIIAQFWAYNAAVNGMAVVYLNGEMSMYQFYERLVMYALAMNLYFEISSKRLTKENVPEFIEKMKEATKHNIFFFNGSGYNKTNITATCEHVKATTGKVVKLIVVDGVTQMDNMGKEEIPAAIMNTGVCKEVAKATNTAVVGLMHVSGEQAGAKIRRDNGPHCRGGGKTIANMDGYFSTSLLIDPDGTSIENPEDVAYRPAKVYIRLVDKRSPAGVVNAIANINQQNLHLEHENVDPKEYEIKIG